MASLPRVLSNWWSSLPSSPTHNPTPCTSPPPDWLLKMARLNYTTPGQHRAVHASMVTKYSENINVSTIEKWLNATKQMCLEINMWSGSLDSRNSWHWKYQCFILTFLLHYFSIFILSVVVRPRHQWRTAEHDHDSGLPRQTVQIICWSAFVHCQSRVAEVRGDRGDEAARSWLSVAITIRKYFHRSNTANKMGIRYR